MNKLILVKKKNKLPDQTVEIDNVVQLDFCNMQECGDDVSDSGWNFISILTKNGKGELQKQVIKLENVWQFSLVKQKDEDYGKRN